MQQRERRFPGQKYFTALVVLAGFGFLIWTAERNWSELRDHRWEIDLGMLLLSIAAHIAVLAWGVFIWSRVLSFFTSPRPSFRHLLPIWSLSSVARYAPGAVWQFVAAAQLSRNAGMSRVLSISSLLVHVAFSLLASATISALLLPGDFAGAEGGVSSAVRVLVILGAVLLVHPRMVNGALQLLASFTRTDAQSWTAGWVDGIALLAIANLSWVFYGVAYYLFVSSLASLPLSTFASLTAVNALAFAAGYIAVFAPGGLGVRESAMTVLLSPFVSPAVAAVISIMARLWSIVAEAALALGSLLLARRSVGDVTGGDDRRGGAGG